MTKTSIIKDVTSFFQNATPVKYSLLLVSFVSFVLILLLLLCGCYLKLPGVLSKLLCCFSGDCCLKTRAMKRSRDKDQLRVIYTVARESQPTQGTLVPSAPLECTPLPVPQTSDIPLPAYYSPQSQLSGSCVNNLPRCFCARFGTDRPLRCMKD